MALRRYQHALVNGHFYGPYEVYLSRIFLESFLKPIYPIIVAEKFQIYGVKITGKYISESKKLNLFLFAHVSKENSPQAKGNFPFHPNSIFWKSIFLPAERGRIMEMKLNLWGYWSQILINSNNLCNLFQLFGFCFVVP